MKMITEKPFIVYSLPKSRAIQQLKEGRKIEAAWKNVCLFLNKCTTAKPELPRRISLTAYTAFQNDRNPELASAIIEETKVLFGKGETSAVAYFYPSNVPSKETKTEWELTVIDLQKAIDYLIKGQPWPRFTTGPIELLLTFHFKLVDPITKKELEDQEKESSIIVWLSRTCVCSPEIYFPFEIADAKFHNLLNTVERFSPFKFEEKYLRLGRLNKSKTQYTFVKLKPG